MYQSLVEEWLRSIYKADPRDSNSVGDSYARRFAMWLDDLAEKQKSIHTLSEREKASPVDR